LVLGFKNGKYNINMERGKGIFSGCVILGIGTDFYSHILWDGSWNTIGVLMGMGLGMILDSFIKSDK